MPSKKKKEETHELEALTLSDPPAEKLAAPKGGDTEEESEVLAQEYEMDQEADGTTHIDEISAEGLADQTSISKGGDGDAHEGDKLSAEVTDLPALLLPDNGNGSDSGEHGDGTTPAVESKIGEVPADTTHKPEVSEAHAEEGLVPDADGSGAEEGRPASTDENGQGEGFSSVVLAAGDSDDEEEVVTNSFTGPAKDTASGEQSATAKKPTKAKKTTKKKKEAGSTTDKATKNTLTKQPEAAAPNSNPDILTIERGDDVENPNDTEAVVWHDIQNANRTKRILTGRVGGVERNEAGGTVVVVYYRGLRVVIPATEMNIRLAADPSGRFGDMQSRQNKIANNMLGAEIDFMTMGIDSRTRSVVASRKAAMLRKVRMFYFPATGNALPQIYPGRLVQARVIAVGEKVVRVEVFGLEYSIMASKMSWDWVGDARERYQVGDEIIVKVLRATGEDPENISIDVSARDVTGNSAGVNLKKIVLQGKYAGTITDIRKGVVYIGLEIGVNAIAHACYDSRRPGRKDVVSFVATAIDWDTGVALGIISRIIKRQL